MALAAPGAPLSQDCACGPAVHGLPRDDQMALPRGAALTIPTPFPDGAGPAARILTDDALTGCLFVRVPRSSRANALPQRRRQLSPKRTLPAEHARRRSEAAFVREGSDDAARRTRHPPDERRDARLLDGRLVQGVVRTHRTRPSWRPARRWLKRFDVPSPQWATAPVPTTSVTRTAGASPRRAARGLTAAPWRRLAGRRLRPARDADGATNRWGRGKGVRVRGGAAASLLDRPRAGKRAPRFAAPRQARRPGALGNRRACLVRRAAAGAAARARLRPPSAPRRRRS